MIKTLLFVLCPVVCLSQSYVIVKLYNEQLSDTIVLMDTVSIDTLDYKPVEVYKDKILIKTDSYFDSFDVIKVLYRSAKTEKIMILMGKNPYLYIKSIKPFYNYREWILPFKFNNKYLFKGFVYFVYVI